MCVAKAIAAVIRYCCRRHRSCHPLVVIQLYMQCAAQGVAVAHEHAASNACVAAAAAVYMPLQPAWPAVVLPPAGSCCASTSPTHSGARPPQVQLALLLAQLLCQSCQRTSQRGRVHQRCVCRKTAAQNDTTQSHKVEQCKLNRLCCGSTTTAVHGAAEVAAGRHAHLAF